MLQAVQLSRRAWFVILLSHSQGHLRRKNWAVHCQPQKKRKRRKTCSKLRIKWFTWRMLILWRDYVLNIFRPGRLDERKSWRQTGIRRRWYWKHYKFWTIYLISEKVDFRRSCRRKEAWGIFFFFFLFFERDHWIRSLKEHFIERDPWDLRKIL